MNGGIELAQDGPLYLDANPIIYAFEGPEDVAQALKKLFAATRRRPGIAISSELTLAEVLPHRRIPDRYFYNLLIWSKAVELQPVTRSILVETAKYRRLVAQQRPDGSIAMPKLPDAVHVMTAHQSGCKRFLSSDLRIKLPDTIRLVSATPENIEMIAQELA
jgi:predicted nucleic acid-binding protein